MDSNKSSIAKVEDQRRSLPSSYAVANLESAH